MELDNREEQRLKKLVPYKVLSPTPDEICDEIERLHSIIKKVREYITSRARKAGVELMPREKELLQILDKVEGKIKWNKHL